MPTYEFILKQAKKLARLENMEASSVELLMLHFSGLTPTELYLNYKEAMPDVKNIEFNNALKLYIYEKKPVQYIIGHVYFYGYMIGVDENVLIPRYETEELVQNVLMLYDELFFGKQVQVLDLGTGSGCIAIALKKEEPSLEVYATDISFHAIEVAKRNAANLNAEINFYQSDLFNAIPEMKFDIIVSNPPYIPETEQIDEIIKKNEPHVALFGGIDGLHFYEQIIENIAPYLKDRFLVAFEHGYDKGLQLRAIAKTAFPKAKIYTEKDMQGKERMTFIIQE